MSDADHVIAAALALPREDRARLTEALLAGLRTDAAIEEGWSTEIRRRIREIDRGETSLISLDAVLREGDELLGI
ncbi:MAG: addiction module protein [Gemmatimonadetes bacterium]|nr:addiction module protein [Gemmatimonadota bacterium]